MIWEFRFSILDIRFWPAVVPRDYGAVNIFEFKIVD